MMELWEIINSILMLDPPPGEGSAAKWVENDEYDPITGNTHRVATNLTTGEKIYLGLQAPKANAGPGTSWRQRYNPEDGLMHDVLVNDQTGMVIQDGGPSSKPAGGGAAGRQEAYPGEFEDERRAAGASYDYTLARIKEIDASIAGATQARDLAQKSFDRDGVWRAEDRIDRLEKEKAEHQRTLEVIEKQQGFTRGEREAGQAYQAGESALDRASREQAQEKAGVMGAFSDYLGSGRLLGGGDTAARIMNDLLRGIGKTPENLTGLQPAAPTANAPWVEPDMGPAAAVAPVIPTAALVAAPTEGGLAPKGGEFQTTVPFDPTRIQTPEAGMPLIPAADGFSGTVDEPTAFIAGEPDAYGNPQPENVQVQPAKRWFNPQGAQRASPALVPYPQASMGAQRTAELGMGIPRVPGYSAESMGARRTRQIFGQPAYAPQASRQPLLPEQQATYGGSRTMGSAGWRYDSQQGRWIAPGEQGQQGQQGGRVINIYS